ncbi:twin-arginine translocase TatA/TatE family subunit [Acinetobacter bereziniae]|uniref:twin-arginine translocase TatA/TatE family subunit n=1 Tax=Acinetobacter bereziniae TaxID=106648 RepID=UPI0009B832A1|nr:twin-arginine translocase TatA/TatE family subunit [Acinetobacter bereziniae]MBJ8450221.1 twin-arginine translocase TatA/TatE family subunit [Acinetobacter bereziniae]MBJ8454744.1 twin-arginine translocase TatA/TatE family subunit [Acinetobacter bereziniae]MBJ9902086.1 twin-arginine translocase TatA/TatE family subunit [Acinetobacter bereziniae]MCU4318196.1 twin-arginine translocase TatA/TatE family subunit [Acinetobacter bereziniae]MCU4600854.1 twin-arginine translocase TatA/TatE family su
MMGMSIGHIALFIIIVLVIFGTAKLKNLGKDVGGAVKDFRKAIKEDDQDSTHLK